MKFKREVKSKGNRNNHANVILGLKIIKVDGHSNNCNDLTSAVNTSLPNQGLFEAYEIMFKFR